MMKETLLNVPIDQPLGDDDSRPSSALVDSSPHPDETTISEPSVGLLQKESLSSLSLSPPPPASITKTPKESISNVPVLSMGHQVSPLLLDSPESGTPVFLDRALIIGERNSCLSNEDKMSSLSTILHPKRKNLKSFKKKEEKPEEQKEPKKTRGRPKKLFVSLLYLN